MREATGLNILKNIGFEEAALTLDPTFLLKEHQWRLFEKARKAPKHYIFTYQLHKNPQMKAYINTMAKKLGIPVVNIAFSWRGYFQSCHAAYAINPEEFIYLIRNADYVITDSFHATAFSIMFGRRFISVLSDEFSNRMKSILALCGLDRRGISDYKDEQLLMEEIDFDRAQKSLDNERMKSLAWLKDTLVMAQKALKEQIEHYE